MREYETMCILKPTTPDSVIQELQARLTKLVQENKGSILALRSLGKKPFAYPMAKEAEGIYLQWNYGGGGSLVTEVEKILRYDERVLRFLTLGLQKNVDVAKRTEELKQPEVA